MTFLQVICRSFPKVRGSPHHPVHRIFHQPSTSGYHHRLGDFHMFRFALHQLQFYQFYQFYPPKKKCATQLGRGRLKRWNSFCHKRRMLIPGSDNTTTACLWCWCLPGQPWMGSSSLIFFAISINKNCSLIYQ